MNFIRVGARSNLQDGVVVHVNAGAEATTVEEEVTVGHQAILHGCHLGRRSLIGMGRWFSTASRWAKKPWWRPARSCRPVSRFRRGFWSAASREGSCGPLTDAEIAHLADSAAHYVELKDRYLSGLREANPA